MIVALFYYTLIVMLVMALSSAICLSAYLVSRQRMALLSCCGFLLYFFDVSLVFLDDFLVPKNALEGGAVYFVGQPVLATLLGAALVAVCWAIACSFLGETRPAFVVAPVLVFLALSMAALLLVPQGRHQEFLFYSVRSLVLLALLGFVAWRTHFHPSSLVRARVVRGKTFLLLTVLLVVLVIAQNVHLLLLTDFDTDNASAVAFFPERNFAENALALLCAFYASRRCLTALRFRAQHPPTGEGRDQERFVDEHIALYIDRYRLSPREGEVLRLLLAGKDGREIASELFLSPSTVKVHVHNVLRKTGSSDRQKLLLHFWSES